MESHMFWRVVRDQKHLGGYVPVFFRRQNHWGRGAVRAGPAHSGAGNGASGGNLRGLGRGETAVSFNG